VADDFSDIECPVPSESKIFSNDRSSHNLLDCLLVMADAGRGNCDRVVLLEHAICASMCFGNMSVNQAS
jgi:hypothetical protein